MQAYSDFQPTGFDSKGAFLPDQGDWLVMPVSRTRDNCDDPITASNWEATEKAMRETGSDDGEGDWEIHRFGHWGPGWFEIILVRPGTPAADAAEEIEGALADYPLLDDARHSELEWEAAIAGIEDAN